MTARPLDRCGECGFDGTRWSWRDLEATVGLVPALIELWSAPLADDRRNERPRPAVWSVLEYADHIGTTLSNMAGLIGLVLDRADDEPEPDLGPIPEPDPPGRPRSLDPGATRVEAAQRAEALAATLRTIGAEDRARAVVLDGRRHTVAWAAVHAVHDTWHHLVDIAGVVADLGAASPGPDGSVDAVNRSGGGVPKEPVAGAAVSVAGLEGDRQRVRRHHGRPWQALCLWSAEVIAELVADGHPMAAGAAGENLTLAGIDWSALHAGLLVEIGDGPDRVRARLTAPAEPCATIAHCFVDRDVRLIDHYRRPGRSRWYAEVLRPGTVRVGDPVRVGSASAAT